MKRLTIVFLAFSVLGTLTFAEPPAESGPFVVRQAIVGFPLNGFLLHGDADSELVAIYGLQNVVEYCMGEDAELDQLELLRVTDPAVHSAIHDLVMGDEVSVTVWEAPFGISCALVLSEDPVASGVVDIVTTDNDLLTFLDPNTSRYNAYGFQARGALTAASGETVRLSAHERCVWDGQDGLHFRCVDQIVLR